MLSEGSHACVWSYHTALFNSSSPLKDSTMSTLWGFLHYLLKFKPLDDIFPSKTWLQISVCLWLECVCVYPLNKDFSQAVIGFFYQCHFQKMVGWVTLKFFFFMLKFKSFRIWRPMSLFILLRFLLSVWNVIRSLQERNVLWNVLIVDHHVKKILYIFSRTARKAL